MFIPSVFWKRQAREALKNHWLTALLIALTVNLPSLLVQGIAAMTGNDIMVRLQEAVYSSMSFGGTALDTESMLRKIEETLGSTGIWAIQGLNAAAWLLTPCLTLGMTAWLLSRLRNQEDPGVTAVFSRMRLFWKGIGLRLYVALRIFLFMLPGVGLSVLAALPIVFSNGTRESVQSAVRATVWLQTLAAAVMIALACSAALKYALGDMVLADSPEMGPIAAAKESKRLTKGRRGPLLALYLSFLLWYVLEMLAVNLCAGMFGTVPALMVEMLGSLAITVYLSASVCAFFLGITGGQPGEDGDEDEDDEDDGEQDIPREEDFGS